MAVIIHDNCLSSVKFCVHSEKEKKRSVNIKLREYIICEQRKFDDICG